MQKNMTILLAFLLLSFAPLAFAEDKPKAHPVSAEARLKIRDKQLAECRLISQQLALQVQALQAAIEQRRLIGELTALVESTRPKDCKTCAMDLEKLEWKK